MYLADFLDATSKTFHQNILAGGFTFFGNQQGRHKQNFPPKTLLSPLAIGDHHLTVL
jgi:hypothetical protein